MANKIANRITQLTRATAKPLFNYNFERRAFITNVKQANLASVKSMTATFDPWNPKSTSIRHLAYSLSLPRIKNSNINCDMKIDIKSDQSAPKFTADFIDGHRAIFHTENLSRVELIKLFNTLCQQRAAPIASSAGPQTKSSNTKPKAKRK